MRGYKRWQLSVLSAGAVGQVDASKDRWNLALLHVRRRFEALWKDLMPVVLTGCTAAVEPNFTVSLDSPRCYALWNVWSQAVDRTLLAERRRARVRGPECTG